MKSNYNFWKLGLISLAGLAGLAGLTGCKELTCDFTYSPTTPVAGQVVSFSNLSTGADDYLWTFGDNSTSEANSPTHIYRKPGKYTVTLTIIRNKVEKRSRTQYVTIEDTIPSLACDSNTIYAFTAVKFYPKIYNPWSKTITYAWTMPDDAVVIAGKSLDSSAVVCYFTQSGKKSEVKLFLTKDGSPMDSLRYSTTPTHRKGISVLYNNGQAMEQFAYLINNQSVYSAATNTQDTTNIRLLTSEQDTMYQYGSTKYTIETVSQLLSQPIVGFQVDRLMGKIYAYNNSGLWVCNMAGTHSRKLVNGVSVKAVKVDGAGNRVYWATSEGIYAHRLMNTETNQELFTPHQVNNAYQITRISINPNLH